MSAADSTDPYRFLRLLFRDRRGIFFGCRGRHQHGTKKRLTWRQKAYAYPQAADLAVEELLAASKAGEDAYVSVRLFTGRKRAQGQCEDVDVLYADGDGCVIPHGFPEPFIVLETSSGHYHYFWLLKQPIPPTQADDLGERLAHYLGADLGGWDATQVLRLPTTVNYTRAGLPVVKLVRADEQLAHDVETFERILPLAPKQAHKRPERAESAGDTPPVRLRKRALEIWRGERPKLKDDGEIDRSGSLTAIGRVLMRAGATRTTIVAALAERDTALGWNKYTERADAEAQYHKIVDFLEANPSDDGPSDEPNLDANGTAARAADSRGKSSDGRPCIDITAEDLPVLSKQVWTALERVNNPPRLFRTGGLPARIQPDPEGALLLAVLGESGLSHEVARAAIFHKLANDGLSVVHPPTWLVKDLLAHPEPPLPPLKRVVEVPVFAPDGTLQTDPGYHPRSRTYYVPPAGLRLPAVPPAPAAADLARAMALLRDELLVDFRFASSADFTNAIALFVLPFVRDMISGPTPLHAIEAATPGTGKGLLTEVILYPATGKHVGMMAQATDEDEWRKRLTARLIEGRQVLVIDNIKRPLDSGTLCTALTCDFWEDRILGRSETVRLPPPAVWVATGNNITYSTEMLRRTVRIRLVADRERPWEREPEEFKHADLRTWAHEHRASLIWAGLTLVQAWIADGRPSGDRTLGSYENWARVIGGILGTAGADGFLSNTADFYETADIEGAAWREFVSLWAEKHGTQTVGVADLFPLALQVDGFDLGRGGERSQQIRFGKQLKGQRDRIVNDYRIAFAGERQRAARWRLIPRHDLFTSTEAPQTAADPVKDVNVVNVVNVVSQSHRGEARARADGAQRRETFTTFTDIHTATPGGNGAVPDAAADAAVFE